MNIKLRPVEPSDFNRCAEIRGMTGDNPISIEVLESIGITESTWAPQVKDGTIVGVVATVSETIIGFCSGEANSGEVLVLALLPEFENYGVGKKMLFNVMELLFESGNEQLWLAASTDPKIRAHGFYRHLGWSPTGNIDQNGDEILFYQQPEI